MIKLMIGLLIAGTGFARPTVKMGTLNMVPLTGEINQKSITETIHRIEGLKNTNIILFIDSPGGSVIAGDQFISYLQSTKKNITCVASFAASMAFGIFQACPTRIVMQHSIIMQHEASFGLDQAPVPHQVSLVNVILKQVGKLTKMQAKRLKMTQREFRGWVRNDFWLYSDNILEYSAADYMADVYCSKTLLKVKRNESVNTMFGKLDLTFSGCPLLSYPLEIKQNKKKGKFKPSRMYTTHEIKQLNRIK
jgi:ATP-dependent protease ClpP protease subunit